MILCSSTTSLLFNLIFQLAQNQEEKRDVIYWMLHWTLKSTRLIARNSALPSYQFFKLPLTKAVGTYKSKRVVAQWSGSSRGSSTMNARFLCCYLLKSDPALPDGQDSHSLHRPLKHSKAGDFSLPVMNCPMYPSFSLNLAALFFFFKVIYLFLAVLALHCYAQAFSSCGKWELLFIVVCGLLIMVAFLVECGV